MSEEKAPGRFRWIRNGFYSWFHDFKPVQPIGLNFSQFIRASLLFHCSQHYRDKMNELLNMVYVKEGNYAKRRDDEMQALLRTLDNSFNQYYAARTAKHFNAITQAVISHFLPKKAKYVISLERLIEALKAYVFEKILEHDLLTDTNLKLLFQSYLESTCKENAEAQVNLKQLIQAISELNGNVIRALPELLPEVEVYLELKADWEVLHPKQIFSKPYITKDSQYYHNVYCLVEKQRKKLKVKTNTEEIQRRNSFAVNLSPLYISSEEKEEGMAIREIINIIPPFPTYANRVLRGRWMPEWSGQFSKTLVKKWLSGYWIPNHFSQFLYELMNQLPNLLYFQFVSPRKIEKKDEKNKKPLEISLWKRLLQGVEKWILKPLVKLVVLVLVILLTLNRFAMNVTVNALQAVWRFLLGCFHLAKRKPSFRIDTPVMIPSPTKQESDSRDRLFTPLSTPRISSMMMVETLAQQTSPRGSADQLKPFTLQKTHDSPPIQGTPKSTSGIAVISEDVEAFLLPGQVSLTPSPRKNSQELLRADESPSLRPTPRSKSVVGFIPEDSEGFFLPGQISLTPTPRQDTQGSLPVEGELKQSESPKGELKIPPMMELAMLQDKSSATPSPARSSASPRSLLQIFNKGPFRLATVESIDSPTSCEDGLETIRKSSQENYFIPA